ncbi:AraC family transcriptional regulator [Vibrio owensii]|uniref:AraC family transcriptional regulator n=1 Tax=Vibrio owensii TaxID=696485 RepID=A0AAP9GGY1_9VIBR|nr:AraC family transcriptional regulator [Vibrio owensii]QGH49996.1 helix-turn-helix domain-containing protein [Vibrio owensii]
MCILRHVSYLLKSQSSNVRSRVMKRDVLNLGEGVNHSIPLIRKTIVYDFLGQLALEPKALAQLQEQADMPFALDTSTAEFIPFHAFSRLLSGLRQHLGAKVFVSSLQRIAKQASLNLKFNQATSENVITSLGLRALSLETTAHVIHVKAHASACDQIEAELFLTVYLHAYLKAWYPNLQEPSAYYLLHPQGQSLTELQIRNDIPQFLGQEHLALEYPTLEEIDSINVCAEDKPFAYYVEQALSAYVGRVDMCLEVFSELIGISKRTVQRSLKQEGTSFREVKEALNFTFAKRVLIQRNSAVGDIAVHLGYADATQFVRAFKRANGITPLQWKKANQP